MTIILFNKKTDSQVVSKGLFQGRFIGIGGFLLLFLTVAYIFQVSQMTKEIDIIQDYNTRLEEIMKEKRSQEYHFLRTGSLLQVEQLAKEAGFERVSTIHHLKVPGVQITAR